MHNVNINFKDTEMITVTRGQWFPLTIGNVMWNGAAFDFSKASDVEVALVSGLGTRHVLQSTAGAPNEVLCVCDGSAPGTGEYSLELTCSDDQGRRYRMQSGSAMLRVTDGGEVSTPGGMVHLSGDHWELTADVEMREAAAKTYMSLLEEARQAMAAATAKAETAKETLSKAADEATAAARLVHDKVDLHVTGRVNVTATSDDATGLKTATLNDDGVQVYVISDGNAVTGGHVTWSKYFLGKFVNMMTKDTLGASLGDLLMVTKRSGALYAFVMPLNDAKAADGDFPGADGLETVWDKTQVNKIPSIQSAVAGIENREARTVDGAQNMNDNLKTGFYPYCTLGRPSGGADDWYTLRTWRSKDADRNGYFSVEQVAVCRGGENLGKVFYRIIFVRDDRKNDNFGEWTQINGGGGGESKPVDGCTLEYLVYDGKGHFTLQVPWKFDHKKYYYMVALFFDGKHSPFEHECNTPEGNNIFYVEDIDYKDLDHGSDVQVDIFVRNGKGRWPGSKIFSALLRI